MKRLLHSPWLGRIAQWAIIVVALAYVTRSVVDNWEALSQYRQQFDPRYLAVSMMAGILGRCLLGLAAHQALEALGLHLDSRTAFRAYHLSGLSSYVPGGLYLGRPVIFAQHGVDVVSTSAGILIEQSTISLVELVGSVPYLLLIGLGTWARSWALGVVMVFGMLVFIHPAVMNRILRWLLKRVGHGDRVVNLTFAQLARMLLLESVFWVTSSVGSLFMISSVYRVPLNIVPALVSAHSLSAFAGRNLSLTPGGLGIREGVSTLLTSPLLPAPVPALVAIMGRLSHTVVVLVMFAIAALMRERSQQVSVAAADPVGDE